MSKKMPTKLEREGDDPDPKAVRNFLTPASYKILKEEQRQLLKEERPKIVEVVAWAAGNGDRSENGDYIYGKKRLREIDRRIRYLEKRLDQPEVIDPKKQQGVDRVFFGATVTYARPDNTEVTVKLVGVDEADFSQGTIYWLSPVGRALMKSQVGDEVKIRKESGVEIIEVLEIVYLID